MIDLITATTLAQVRPDPRAGRWASVRQAAALAAMSLSALHELIECGRVRASWAFGHLMVDLGTLGSPGSTGEA